MYHSSFRSFFVICAAAALCQVAVAATLEQTTITGMGSIEAGQVIKGENRQAREWETPPNISHVWYQRAYMHLGVSAQLSERARVDMIGEAKITYSWRIQQEFYDDLVGKYYFYPHHMEGSYRFGNVDRPYLTLGAGIFPYKYNRDVHNLGEYLYRTGTYPGYIASEFDFPLARLTGFRASSELSFFGADSLHTDLMLTAETQLVPLNDWGVSLLSDYTLFKSLTLGGGIFFSHLLSVCERYTTPRIAPNNIAKIDTAANDTLFYTFRGTKLMARMAFDPKPFFDTDFFGPNDLRLYSEAAIIGLKNYPGHYDTLSQRIPFMIGFNWPTHPFAAYFSALYPVLCNGFLPDSSVDAQDMKELVYTGGVGIVAGAGTWLLEKVFARNLRLDVIAVEWEYYGSRIPNSYQEVFFRRSLPIPDLVRLQDGNWDGYQTNHVKWSLYANKTLANFFTITGQIAFDHTRLLRHDQKNQDLEETMHKAGDWSWMLKTQFAF